MNKLDLIRNNYIGTMDPDTELSLEQAAKYRVITKWSCNKGHIFEAFPDFAYDIINGGYCPCCQREQGGIYDFCPTEYKKENSLFELDQELFGGQIERYFVQTENNYINNIEYNSTKGVCFNIAGKARVISPKKFVEKITEANQERLRFAFENGIAPEKFFEVIRCEACGKYMVHYRYGKKNKNSKCPYCDNFIYKPFSLGRWLVKHPKIRKQLQELVSEQDYKRLQGLNKDDEYNEIILMNIYGIRTVNAFMITHGLVF